MKPAEWPRYGGSRVGSQHVDAHLPLPVYRRAPRIFAYRPDAMSSASATSVRTPAPVPPFGV